ncbi:MAG: ABC transporter substrate-binding protein [Candidatus Pacebacteria bacterium]|nr:ABC transporter substrate-binding protein [Candidatus Paceibacterota bacterium]
MNKKILLSIAAVILLLISVPYFKGTKPNELTIGALLPLSGPASVWGENIRNGMELALQDKQSIKIIYEDSKGTPADGVSAFHALKQKGSDILVSALSAVSVPVSKVALEEKTPLLATLTAADNIVNDYATRIYSSSANFAEPAFTASSSPVISATKIAVIYRNDELGNSVFRHIQELSTSNNKEIVYSASFKPNETDFTTVVTKVRATGAEVLIFVPVTPGEALGIVKIVNQLGLNIPLVESSTVLASMSSRSELGNTNIYFNAYNFSVPGNSEEFKSAYKQKYNTNPNFAGAFGYDVVNTIYACKDKKTDIEKCIRETNNLNGVAGTAVQVAPGDFNIPLHLEKVN